jgi:uncharacterized membrane protein YqaE (UPF0057 family)
MHTFHWGNPKVYVLTNFIFQAAVPFVGVALLTGLGSQNVCMDLLHLPFCLSHTIGAKDDPLT